ncbi:MAG: lipid-A-disaccharide synthase [Chloracidobacterium sp.]|nr:lipid-A-disaccharide synthase [Chloracidobacterium sp.]MDW8216012.1 lipid-A-disaccharide synthase [Acidobacteriota bacterium]
MTRSIFIVAGEASGDAHAAELVRELQRLATQDGGAALRFWGMGGAAMAAAGVAPLTRMEAVSVIGIVEVLRHLPTIRRVFHALVADVERERPDLAILVDFPDFNLRLAKQLARHGVPVVWYISPQVWAWRSGRVKTLKRLVTQMLVLFPFEVDFYAQRGMAVTFVGHPLLDRVPRFSDAEKLILRERLGWPPDGRIVALLPGSRRSELRHYLPPMLAAAERLAHTDKALHFVIPRAPSLDEAHFTPFMQKAAVPIRLTHQAFYETLAVADAAVVASGTATLEAALIGTPMVIVGKVAPLTAAYLRRFAPLAYVGLVNYVMGEVAVPELLQEQVTGDNIAQRLQRLLTDETERERLQTVYAAVRARLGERGASARAAQAVWRLISPKDVSA